MFCTLCLLFSLKGISKCSDVISLKVANVFPLYSSILSLVGFNNVMGTNLSRETITTLLETKSPLAKIYLLEVPVPCFPNKIFEESLPQTIVS
jgi:uncharacterized membrane protein